MKSQIFSILCNLIFRTNNKLSIENDNKINQDNNDKCCKDKIICNKPIIVSDYLSQTEKIKKENLAYINRKTREIMERKQNIQSYKSLYDIFFIDYLQKKYCNKLSNSLYNNFFYKKYCNKLYAMENDDPNIDPNDYIFVLLFGSLTIGAGIATFIFHKKL